MASLNKVLLIGNLTRDPDVRMMSNGRPVCNFGLALNRNYKDSEGNRKEEVTFVDVECFGPRAEAVAKFFTKGRSIFVEGRLKLDQWESKEGEKRSAIRVVLDNFEFLTFLITSLDKNTKAINPIIKIIFFFIEYHTSHRSSEFNFISKIRLC